MNKLTLADRISTVTNPPIITIPLFLIICIVLSYEGGSFDFNKFLILEAISLVFASILPMAIIVYWAKKLNTDKDISNRQDRYTPLIIGIISYFIGFLISFIIGLSNFLTFLLLCYCVNTGVVLIITSKWKISVHTTGISGPIGALILLLGPVGALFGVIYPVVIWSRVLLKKHTLAQAICGGVQGFFLTVIEMYLYMYLFRMPVYGMISLESSILYIMAIITTPVILGILSYANVKKTKILFIVLEIIAFLLFIGFTPLSAVAVFVIISGISIFISYWAGDEFVWFNVINSS